MIASPAHERPLLLETVDQLSRQHIAPRAAQIDASAEFPADVVRAFAEAGLLAACVPPAHGGVDIGLLTLMLCVERISRDSATCGLLLGTFAEASDPLVIGGSPKLKERLLPLIGRGDAIPCFAVTEPGAGSDAGALRTTARRDGDRYLLTGQKLYCSNGTVGDCFSVLARTEQPGGAPSYTVFLVERGAPGFEIGRSEDLVGLRGLPATELSFEDVAVSADARLGAEGEGFKIAMSMLDLARLTMCAVALGTARASLALAVGHARDRESFGRPLIDHQGVGFMLADRYTDLASAWTLFRQAIDAHLERPSRAASTVIAMAKVAATRAATAATRDAVQVFGGSGLTKDIPVERMLRDATAFEVLDGTTQIQQVIISRRLAKADAPLHEIGWH